MTPHFCVMPRCVFRHECWRKVACQWRQTTRSPRARIWFQRISDVGMMKSFRNGQAVYSLLNNFAEPVPSEIAEALIRNGDVSPEGDGLIDGESQTYRVAKVTA